MLQFLSEFFLRMSLWTRLWGGSQESYHFLFTLSQDREREKHVCSNHSSLNVAHYPRVKKKTLGRQRSTQNAGICSKMGIHLIKAQIFSFHKIALIADAHQNNF